MLSLEPGSLPRLYQKSLNFSDQPIEVGKNIMNANRTASLVRKATISDLSRIAGTEIFNCRPYGKHGFTVTREKKTGDDDS